MAMRPYRKHTSLETTRYWQTIWTAVDVKVSGIAESYSKTLITLAVFSCVVLLPSLMFGVNQTDSSGYNYVWAKQFAELTLSGHIYPRWFPQSFSGFGSPAFIFYPPLAFFVDACVNAITLNLVLPPHRLAMTAAVLLWFSGATMYSWLVGITQRKTALAASIFYIAAPFHLTDHYWRGALAEFSLFAILPLVMLGIRSAAQSWKGTVGLAVSFSFLIMAHLPTALLSSISIIPIYTFYASARHKRLSLFVKALFRCGLGGAFGLGLVAFYLLPALSLQDNISTEQLWSSYFLPERWLLLKPALWSSPQFMSMITSFALAFVLVAVCIIYSILHKLKSWRYEPMVWALTSMLSILLMAGVIPNFWTDIPLIAKVQFPWRIMVIAEFSIITAFAASVGQLPQRDLVRFLFAAFVVALPGFGILAIHSLEKIANTAAYWESSQPYIDAHMPDASEYLPAGFPKASIKDISGPAPWKLANSALTVCEPSVTLCDAAVVDSLGTVSIKLKSEVPTTITVNRFYFPSWQAKVVGGALLSIQPAPPYQLLRFVVPAGSDEILLFVDYTSAEKLGFICSAATLSVLLTCHICLGTRIRKKSGSGEQANGKPM